MSDLEGLFAGLYALRLPILVATGVFAVVVVVLAVRGRWDRVALRHPVAAGAIVVGLLVVGLPLAWYLGSPLLISTELVEPAPVALTSPEPSAVPTALTPSAALPAPSIETVSPIGSATPSVAPPDADTLPEPSAPVPAVTETRGEFTGTDDFHFGRGTARLIVAADGTATLRLEHFVVRNGPDLFVYLSPKKDRYTAGAIELGRLKADRGSFNYRVPAGTDLSAVKSAVIWCKQFSFQFALAPLS
jgi:hypothetical protein